MERDGKKVQTIECDKFQSPYGVAAGPNGALYVTDVSSAYTVCSNLMQRDDSSKQFVMNCSIHALLRSFRINCMLQIMLCLW